MMRLDLSPSGASLLAESARALARSQTQTHTPTHAQSDNPEQCSRALQVQGKLGGLPQGCKGALNKAWWARLAPGGWGGHPLRVNDDEDQAWDRGDGRVSRADADAGGGDAGVPWWLGRSCVAPTPIPTTPNGKVAAGAALLLPLGVRLRREAGQLSEDEVAGLEAFLTPLLAWEPEARPSAAAALQHPWLKE